MTIEIGYLFKSISDWLISEGSVFTDTTWYSLIITILLILLWIINMSYESNWRLFKVFIQTLALVFVSMVIHKNIVETIAKESAEKVELPEFQGGAKHAEQPESQKNSLELQPETDIQSAREAIDSMYSSL